jgi:hypothetical protein
MYLDGVGGLRSTRRRQGGVGERRQDMIEYIVLSNFGSDAGYSIFRDGHWEHVGGWGVDSIREVQAGLAVLKASTQLRTPELAQSIAELITKTIGPELAEHAAGGQTVIIA